MAAVIHPTTLIQPSQDIPVQKIDEYKAKSNAERSKLAEPALFDSSYIQTYNIESHMYPSDLMDADNIYGGNFVIFYINVHQDSYLIKEGGESSVVDGRAAPREQSNARGLNEAGVKSAGVIAGAVAGIATGAATRLATGAGSPLGGGIGNVANAAAGGILAERAISSLGGAVKSYKQIKTAVALHVPNDLSVRYNAEWGTESTLGVTAISEVADAFITKGIGAAATETSGYLVNRALQMPGIGRLISKTSGVAANPKKEQLFQEVGFRTFSFSYQFYPRSAVEAQQVRNILKTFRLHMHPEFKDSSQFLYLYPSEFDIVFYNNNVENLNIPRYATCVLTDLTINYTPQSQFSAFEDGMPSQINVNLTFKELALLTRESVDIGY
jgi:hypothetical protein